VSVRNCSWDLTIQDAGNANTQMFLYGGVGTLGVVIGTQDPPANNLRWEIDDVNHTLQNGIVAGTNPVSPTVIVVLSGFAFTPASDSRFIVRDSRFQYVNYPNMPTNIYSARDNITAGGFVQLFDDKWVGLTISDGAGGSTPYVPQDSPLSAFPASVAVIYEAVSATGAVSFSGGLQTGTKVFATPPLVYTVSDGDAILVIPAAAGGTTVTLPAPGNRVFVGKLVVIYNNSSTADTITIASSGPAGSPPQNMIVAGQTRTYVTYDGTNWILVASFP
jgi:hypothetical protein